MRHFDWFLLSLTLIIVGVGIINLYSASQAFALKQAYWLGLGVGALLLMVLIDYRHLRRYAYAVYFLCLLLLLAVLLVGRTGLGAQRWLDLLGLSLQPSELMKLGLILALARYFDEREGERDIKGLLLPFLLLIAPVLLVLKQPDLGTSVILVLVFFSILFLVKVRLRVWVSLVSATVLASPFSWFFLKEYQKLRIMSFLNPQADPLGAGYQSLQSKIAVGSGGVLGRGFLEGTQTRLRFLPQQKTDFIFSVQAEEWGFLGALFLLSLYLLWISWGLGVSARSRDRFGSMVAFGIVSVLTWQVIINVAMTVGLVPVVGVPLPFMSYGGSALVTFLMATGLLINIHMRRFIY